MSASARYDYIGRGYDTTRHADRHLVDRIYSLLAPSSTGRYLDVACGSGNYTLALADFGFQITGIDQSGKMIETARTKSSDAQWLAGDSAALPFRNQSFDGAICTLAIHHFRKIGQALVEIHRVLRGGRFVLLTAAREQMRGYWLNAYFPEAMRRSIEQMPDLEVLKRKFAKAGFTRLAFETYNVREDLQDLFLYSGKQRPHIYLDRRVRAGISTFSLLADPEEVESGCRMLEADIASGRIETIIRSYQHAQGDYLFITAEAGASTD